MAKYRAPTGMNFHREKPFKGSLGVPTPVPSPKPVNPYKLPSKTKLAKLPKAPKVSPQQAYHAQVESEVGPGASKGQVYVNRTDMKKVIFNNAADAHAFAAANAALGKDVRRDSSKSRPGEHGVAIITGDGAPAYLKNLPKFVPASQGGGQTHETPAHMQGGGASGGGGHWEDQPRDEKGQWT